MADNSGEIVAWVLAATASTGIAVKTTMSALWKSEKDSQRELVETLKRQALSSETRAIASDAARGVAEKRAGELEMKYGHIKQQLQRCVRALEIAQVTVDPGAFVGTISSPPGPEEPTGVWSIEADRRASYFLNDEKADAELQRQSSLNPESERLERERIDKLSRQYLEESSRRR